jgi:hypothetical protein
MIRDYSLHHHQHSGRGAHLDSCSMDNGHTSLEVTCKIGHSPLTNAEVNNMCSFTPTPLYTPWHALKEEGQLYIYLTSTVIQLNNVHVPINW